MNFYLTNQPQRWDCEHLRQTLVQQQSVTKFTAMITVNLVTPEGAAKLELFFNKPASEASLLNKVEPLAEALSVTKFMTMFL